MMQISPIAKELLLIGGGHSHVLVLRMLAMNPIPGLQITLISPAVKTPYSGMLPGVVAGHYEEDDIHIDLVPLCRFAGARFVQTGVTGLDPAKQLVKCDGRPDFSYDILSIDIGITPSTDDVPGAADNVIPVKPIDQFLDRWDAFRERVVSNEVNSVGFVGAGAGGVELCLAVQHRLETDINRNREQAIPALHLFHDGSVFLKEYTPRIQDRFKKVMEGRKIRIWPNFRVERIVNKTLHSIKGEQIQLDEIFWVTAAAPQSWLKATGLKLTDSGFIEVSDTLQSINYPNIFAVGDIAHVSRYPRPKAGVYAVRQGPPLEGNIRRLLLGKSPLPFKPQSEFLSLISTGDKSAIAHRNGLSLSGRWVWQWKNWIDQRFMKRFSDLPVMQSPKAEGLLAGFDDQMQCGGCGSKVSAQLLNEVLDSLGIAQQNGAARDDAAVYKVPDGKLMLHSIDSFRSFIDDPFVFARVAVTHALSDIYAMGGTPVTALAVVTVPFATPVVTKNLLQQLLSGALHQLDIDGVELVGGHTSEGIELSIGFAVNGIADKENLLTKSGLSDGDRLVLTKPLGTGALFAADMQHKAKGRWINPAIRNMEQSNRQAMEIMNQAGATACTDVTGFGLAGHLMEMVKASNCGVVLDLQTLPVLDGAVKVIQGEGITSTLHEGNRAAVVGIPVIVHEHYELLFDPQTSGGLLASIPGSQVDSCLTDLHQAGYDAAAVVGEVVSNTNGISFKG